MYLYTTFLVRCSSSFFPLAIQTAFRGRPLGTALRHLMSLLLFFHFGIFPQPLLEVPRRLYSRRPIRATRPSGRRPCR